MVNSVQLRCEYTLIYEEPLDGFFKHGRVLVSDVRITNNFPIGIHKEYERSPAGVVAYLVSKGLGIGVVNVKENEIQVFSVLIF